MSGYGTTRSPRRRLLRRLRKRLLIWTTISLMSKKKTLSCRLPTLMANPMKTVTQKAVRLTSRGRSVVVVVAVDAVAAVVVVMKLVKRVKVKKQLHQHPAAILMTI